MAEKQRLLHLIVLRDNRMGVTIIVIAKELATEAI